MPNISMRGATLPASPIRKLTPYAEAARREGVKIYHLNIGQPDLPTPPQALEVLGKIDRKTLEYSPSQGLLSLREAFSRYYHRAGLEVSPDDIIVTCGGSEAVLMAFLTCLDPGDEVIMTEPSYANYMAFAQQAGLEVRTIPSDIREGFALPPMHAFEDVITPRTRAVLICNPNNPTGYVYSREELLQLRDIVLKYNLFLISDEVYREFVYTDEPFCSVLTLPDLEDHVIVVDSVSKRYSECGIRIGMAVSRNREVREAVLRFCQARLSPPLIGQIVAEASIDGTEDYLRACYVEYRARRDFFMAGLQQIPGVYSPMPQGAFYTTASLPVEDAEDFCRWCLTDFRLVEPGLPPRTVMLAPAAGFYMDPSRGRNQVRMAYVLNREDLADALKVLRLALEAYPGARG